MKKLLFLVVLLIAGTANAQTFQKTIGGSLFDYFITVRQTSDGGYICAGQTKSFGEGQGDYYLVRTDSDGNLVWEKTYGGPAEEFAFDLQLTNDGGFIITGWTASFGAGGQDGYLIKTDSIGNLLWSKTYGGFADDAFYSVNQTTDGGFIASGFTKSYGAGNEDIYIIKTDINGDTLWTRTIGGIERDGSLSGFQTALGDYVICGYTESYGSGSFDGYVVKLSSSGSLLWTKTYGGINADEFVSCIETSDTGYAFAGFTSSYGIGAQDIYVVKTDNNGDTLWTKVYGTIGFDNGNGIVQLPDGGYVVAGLGGDNWTSAFAIRTDANGDTLWTRLYGSTSVETANTIEPTNDNGFVMCGNTSGFGTFGGDGYLIKTDDLGRSKCNEFRNATFVSGTATSISSGGSVDAGGTVANAATIANTSFSVDSLLCYSVGITIPVPRMPNMLIYPNPGTGIFTVKDARGPIEIYDLFGRLLLRSNEQQIDMSSYPAGLYVWRVGEARGKLVKE